MARGKNIFSGLAVMAYTVAFIAVSDELHESLLITSIALMALSGWLHGVRAGLLSIILFLFLNTALLHITSASSGILLTYNPLGIVLALFAVFATGSMHESHENQDRLRAELASGIDECDAELDALTHRLIAADEKERIQIGQDLHDGVGQYLTGMLIHSEALALDLRKEKRVEADLAEWMTRRIHKNIQSVRRLSLTLLPIQPDQTSLETAVEKMTEYFSEISKVAFRQECNGDSGMLPVLTAQYLYRIIHEAVYCAIYRYKAREVDIVIAIGKNNCSLKLENDGISRQAPLFSDLESRILEYRAKAIDGKLLCAPRPGGGLLLECTANLRKRPNDPERK